MKQRRQVTIKEVAEHAGVSQMTVSRALNQKSLLRDETLQRVEEAIRDLNYRPNLMARGLAAGRSYYIGLIYNNPSRSYLGEILLGALQRCRVGGHHLVIEDFSPEAFALNPEEITQKLRVSGLDAVILIPPLAENTEIIEMLKAIGMTYVLVAPRSANAVGLSVSMDDTAAAYAMTQHLIDTGHRRIAFINHPAHVSSAHRFEGYKAALARNKIKFSKSYIGQGAFTYESGMDAAANFLSLSKPPTAIFAANDDMAAGVIAAALQRGLKVPDDLSVAGFDDTAIASAVWPTLTTIRQPIAEMAYCAVDLIETALRKKPKKDMSIVLDYSLVERRSVAPPKK